jgi:phosphomannomutase
MKDISLTPLGWRGIIAKEFTFENVEILSQAIAVYLKEQITTPVVIVGFDNRFLSEEFARTAAEVLIGNQIKVLFCASATPTPAIAYEIIRRKASAGIIITASHNPPIYNGLKFNTAHGGSASKEITSKINQYVDTISQVNKLDYRKGKVTGMVEEIYPKDEYLSHIKSIIDISVFKRKTKKICVVIDPLYGSAAEYLGDVLTDIGCRVVPLHTHRDPLFGNNAPDPKEITLQELAEKVVLHNAQIGVATDGDADRFGIVDINGDYISPNYIIALLCNYLLKNRTQDGIIVRTISTTHMLDAIAKKYNIPCIETKPGFRNVTKWMKKDKVILGCEESGGITVGEHIPEKDGILGCLLTIEMVQAEGKSIKNMLEELFQEIGTYFSKRIDLPIMNENNLVNIISQRPPQKFGNISVKDSKDGKFILEDGSWILFRQSSTEPLLRIYVETYSQEQLNTLIDICMEFVEKQQSF